MKNLKIGELKKRIKAAAVVLLALSFAVPLAAGEKRKGAEVLIHKKDGQMIKAELLAVKEDRLILMDASDSTDVTCTVEDIQSLRIVKRAKIMKGLGIGSLSGGIAGSSLGLLSGNDEPGFMSFTAGQKAAILGIGLAVMGGVIGAVSGAIAGIDESVDLEGRSSADIENILRKLDRQARFPQLLPGDASKHAAEPQWGRERNPSSPEPARAKFKRFHLTYRPGYSQSQAAGRCANLFGEIGFGDTKPAQEFSFFGFSFGTSSAINFPQVVEKSKVTYGDVRVDYSVTRKLAVGVGLSSLGECEVNGYRYIPINRGGMDYYTELYLNARLSGRLYYLMVSYMPLPDGFLKKATFVLGAGAGWGRVDLSYSTSKSGSYGVPDDQITLSKHPIAALGLAEFDYFFSRAFSLGLSVEYRYAPVRVGCCCLQGVYYDLDEDGQLVERSMLVKIPEHRANSGGFRFGIGIGFHL
jgi:hypothetical protein